MARDFLFDIGNVILRFDFSPALRELAARSSRPGDDPFGPLETIKLDFESGRIDDDAFIAQSVELLGFDGTRDDFARIWCDIFEINAPMAGLIETLSEDGHNLYLLSNTNGLHKDFFLGSFPVFRLFRGGVFSHLARAMKPGEEIYRQAFDAFNLAPESTIYIDDLEANIATGRKLGLQSIHYHPDRHDEVPPQLEAAGVSLGR